MKKDQWFHLLIAGVLIVQAALTAHQISRTGEVISANVSVRQSTAGVDPIK